MLKATDCAMGINVILLRISRRSYLDRNNLIYQTRQTYMDSTQFWELLCAYNLSSGTYQFYGLASEDKNTPQTSGKYHFETVTSPTNLLFQRAFHKLRNYHQNFETVTVSYYRSSRFVYFFQSLHKHIVTSNKMDTSESK
jgi:hypothetical protein